MTWIEAVKIVTDLVMLGFIITPNLQFVSIAYSLPLLLHLHLRRWEIETVEWRAGKMVIYQNFGAFFWIFLSLILGFYFMCDWLFVELLLILLRSYCHVFQTIVCVISFWYVVVYDDCMCQSCLMLIDFIC